ncbi:hypothetical protein TNCT_103741 [Trichonephila clavata]|uniref:Secreted protein n=1 Tax=Trichonephila clavata TaxID=2740835 RepID=A0A8X6FR82_TRICU|nr:hypothetical protein TNCT_103741 [Trichonephila clavata]
MIEWVPRGQMVLELAVSSVVLGLIKLEAERPSCTHSCGQFRVTGHQHSLARFYSQTKNQSITPEIPSKGVSV